MTNLSKAASIILAIATTVSARSVPSAFISGSRTFQSTASALNAAPAQLPVVCDESVMSKKAHGTSEKPVMKDLKWGCDYDTADKICNFNRYVQLLLLKHDVHIEHPCMPKFALLIMINLMIHLERYLFSRFLLPTIL
jgi:hypothetical protein